ncbi:MAG: E3 binding domain-containing protein, partial [Waddliaceae bacterium]
MPFTFTMPKLSPTMEVGTIAKWYKKEGEHLEPGELLLEVSTDKATIEHNVLDGGWLRKILVQDGEEARVNQPIAIFTEEADESIEGYQPEGVSEKPVPEPVVFPSMAEPIEEEVKVAPEPKEALIQPKFVPEPPSPAGPVGQRIKASPLARKLAKDKGIDLTTVNGTGPGGRVMSYDLERAEKLGTLALGEREHPMLAPGTYEEEELTPIRKVISQRLQESKTFIPHFYVNMAVDVQPLTDIREELRNLDIRISINDFIVRACALAL